MSISHSEVTNAGRLAGLATPTARRLAGVITFTLLIVLSSKVSLPVPGTAVPFTFQPLVVLLGGALLGPRMGAASAILYLTAGAAGLPVFALPGAGAAYLLGPTGGYLLAYPFAAYVTGLIAGVSVLRNLSALLVGFATIYAGGLSWLAIMGSWSTAVMLGLAPFLAADLVKVALGVAVAAGIRARSRALFGA